jgi:chromate transporter
LKLAAVAVVAQAVWSMARTLCPDRPRASIAALAAAGALLAPTSAAQVFIIIAGGLAGVIFTDGVVGAAPPVGDNTIVVSRRAGLVCLAAFAILLALSCVGGLPGLFAACYRAGALVFGGGHVVLPLLRDALVRPGYVSDAAFLAGYGAAQAVPGPLFTVAAYLGTVSAGVAGGLAALAGIFLPGLLIVAGALPFWQAAQGLAKAQAAMAGVNAAVVGLLGAAFYTPIVTGAVRGPADAAVALGGFVLLVAWRAPPWLVVALCAAAGLAIVAAGPVG